MTAITTPPSAVHRSPARAAVVTVRFSVEERDELRARARAAGVGLQDYLYMRALDRPRPAPRRPGPTQQTQDALPVPDSP